MSKGEQTFRWPYCRCTNIVDGDTIDIEIDRGFHDIHTERLRLIGINCPEIRGGTAETKAAGQAAKSFTFDTISKWQANPDIRWPLTVVTYAMDDFDRYLAEVYSSTIIYGIYSLNQMLLDSGHAVLDVR